jgi:hypothetical protein
MRMAQVEKQIDDLTARIENLSGNVDSVANSVGKLATSVGKLTDTVSSVLDKVDVVDKWRVDTDQFVVNLESTMTNLMPRVLALEQAPKAAPPIVPPREEEGRASGHIVKTNHQGVMLGNFTPHATLVKGEHKNPNPTFICLRQITLVVVVVLVMILLKTDTSTRACIKILGCLG